MGKSNPITLNRDHPNGPVIICTLTHVLQVIRETQRRLTDFGGKPRSDLADILFSREAFQPTYFKSVCDSIIELFQSTSPFPGRNVATEIAALRALPALFDVAPKRTSDQRILSKFSTESWTSAGRVGVPGATANRLVRQGLLLRRLKDPRLKVAATWEYRRPT